MDPPPIPSHITATPIGTIAQQNYSDSASSSPRSRQNDTWEQESLALVSGAKLRLICSYGGHIIPRPHDKSLCYVGGDTRIVVAERQSSLADLQSRLSHTLLNGRRFSLKYQLPNEELDSLVSVTTDEDLDNMIEEYDRAMSASPLKPSRLRLFLFLAKPETAASMGCLLADSKSETWFVDALNNASMLSRGLSDSAAEGNFLELERIPKSDSGVNLDQAQNESLAANNRQMAKNVIQEVQSTMPDSPMVETTSSFESSVSSPSMPNLPQIKVRAENGQMNARFHDQMLGLDEQFSNMNVASNAQNLEDAYLHLAAQAATPPLPTVIGGAAVTSSATLVNAAPATGEHHGRVISDDEKSDHGAPSGRRKPPLPLQPIQRKVGDAYSLPSPDSKHAGGYNLQSPDSVARYSSLLCSSNVISICPRSIKNSMTSKKHKPHLSNYHTTLQNFILEIPL